MARAITPEEIRAERIANLQDPEARAVIDKVLEDRRAKLIELREKQNQTYEKHVAELLKQKETARNGPYPAPRDMKDAPALDQEKMNWLENEAKGDMIRRYETQWKATAMPYDQKVDRMLDAAERKQEHAHGHSLHRESLDRSDR
jgi:thymidylate synthase